MCLPSISLMPVVAALSHGCHDGGHLTVATVQVYVQHAAVLAVWHHSAEARSLRVSPA